MSHLKEPHPLLWLRACLIAAWLLLALLPTATRAQQPVTLEDAARDGRIVAKIAGHAFQGQYTQPSINLSVTNTTGASLVLQARAGLILASGSADYANLIVGREHDLPVGAGRSADAALCAFSLNPALRFPSRKASYTAQIVTEDAALLALLSKIDQADMEGEVVSQIAVWMQAGELTFNQVEAQLGISLGQFLTETMSLIESGPGHSTVTAIPPEDTAVPPREDDQAGSDMQDMLIPGIGLIGALAVVAGLVLIRRYRERGENTTSPRGPVAPPRAEEAILPPREPSEEEAEDSGFCSACSRPVPNCICDQRNRLRAPRMLDHDHLEILNNEFAGQTFRCPDVDGVLISSQSLPLCVIARPKVSAPHALLSLVPSCGIKDLNSIDGTFVDGQRCYSSDGTPYMLVEDGSRIRLGLIELQLAIEPKQAFLVDPEGRKYPVARNGRTVLSGEAFGYTEIDDRSISSPHLLLRRNRDGAGYIVRDLNSTNGSGLAAPGDVDYHPFPADGGKVIIMDGHRLRLGRVQIKLHAISQAASGSSTIQKIGNYVIVDRLGNGGMARVFKALDQANKLVAIKVPHDRYAYDLSFRERFKLEAENMKRVVHPNVVPVFEVDEDRSPGRFVRGMGLQYIVMAFIDGCTLADLLFTLGKHSEFLPTDVVVELTRSVAKALGAAHQQEIIHRDVKPSNFLIQHDGQIFLSDFGIARAMSASALTQPNERYGAAWYMSPEYANNKAADYRSDIYSLGVVMYEMLVGRVPFNHGRPSDAVLAAHIGEQPPSLWDLRADVDKHLAEMALKCLSKSPTDRYQQISDLLDALPPVPSAAAELARLVNRYCNGWETERAIARHNSLPA